MGTGFDRGSCKSVSERIHQTALDDLALNIHASVNLHMSLLDCDFQERQDCNSFCSGNRPSQTGNSVPCSSGLPFARVKSNARLIAIEPWGQPFYTSASQLANSQSCLCCKLAVQSFHMEPDWTWGPFGSNCVAWAACQSSAGAWNQRRSMCNLRNFPRSTQTSGTQLCFPFPCLLREHVDRGSSDLRLRTYPLLHS